ncbi:hypothetical protein RB195_012612 [Necator americanus]|uniref:Uncharacterized protein n=1 Tax=Necator americanus TaxID=51031 RepID=A0ABR1DRY2_NECAM
MDTALGPGHYPEVTTAARSERVTGAFSSSASSCLIRGGRVSGLCFRTENPTKESNEDEVEMKNEEREDEEEGKDERRNESPKVFAVILITSQADCVVLI